MGYSSGRKKPLFRFDVLLDKRKKIASIDGRISLVDDLLKIDRNVDIGIGWRRHLHHLRTVSNVRVWRSLWGRRDVVGIKKANETSSYESVVILRGLCMDLPHPPASDKDNSQPTDNR